MYTNSVNNLSNITTKIQPDALFNALANGIADNKTYMGKRLPQNTFPEGIVNNGNFITMKSFIVYKEGVVSKKKYFIPFTANGDLVEDYMNGYIDIYPTYHIMVIETSTASTGGFSELVAIYHMNSSAWEDVRVNEYGRRVTEREMRSDPDGIYVARNLPHAFSKLSAEHDFFEDFKSGKIRINIAE